LEVLKNALVKLNAPLMLAITAVINRKAYSVFDPHPLYFQNLIILQLSPVLINNEKRKCAYFLQCTETWVIQVEYLLPESLGIRIVRFQVFSDFEMFAYV
jgi:hypothetical protein